MRFPWLLGVLMLGGPPTLHAASQTGTGGQGATKVGAPVYATLERAQKVRVLVAFEESDKHAAATQRRAAIAARVDALLAGLPAGSFALKRRFDLVPALALEVDAHALPALSQRPDVLRVDLDDK